VGVLVGCGLCVVCLVCSDHDSAGCKQQGRVSAMTDLLAGHIWEQLCAIAMPSAVHRCTLLHC
jgi:hypothetical protein